MEFPPKLRPKKGWKQQPEEAPFPVPIQSFTSKPIAESRWFYYSAQLINGSVIVQSGGDSHFLYKMGFFGKGVFSRGKPEHTRMMSSYQGVKRKSLPATERRFQQERFQKVRQHRYEQHLSWKKMKDAQLKGKTETTNVQDKDASSASTTKSDEKELDWKNVPSTSSVRSHPFYAMTLPSNDSSDADKSLQRNVEEKFPPLGSDSCSEISSSTSVPGSPRVPPKGSPVEEEQCDFQQTLEKRVEKESSSTPDQLVGVGTVEGKGEFPTGVVDENVKKKKREMWLTDASDWDIKPETETSVTKRDGGAVNTPDQDPKTPGEGEESFKDEESLKGVTEEKVRELAMVAEESERKSGMVENVESDTEGVSSEGRTKSDTRNIHKRKLEVEKEHLSSEGIVKKRKLSDEGEGSPRNIEEREPVKPSQSWQVDEEQWEMSEFKVTSENIAAEESVEKDGMGSLEPVFKEVGEKKADSEKGDALETAIGDEKRESDQRGKTDVNIADEEKERLKLQRRLSQDEDDGEEADTEEDVVKGEDENTDQRQKSIGVKGDSAKNPSKKKTLVRKPDPYPVSEFLQLSYEEAFFLSYGLGCLSLYKYSPNSVKGKPMDLCEMWLEFLTLKPRFVATYACYHYYRSKGWVPRCGIKYGCDFVVYRKGPSFYHSSFAVLAHLVSEDSQYVTALSSWSRFTGFSRIVENAAKDVVVCFVNYPDALTKLHLRSPACIPNLKVQEMWVKRWRPSRERAAKDFPSLIS